MNNKSLFLDEIILVAINFTPFSGLSYVDVLIDPQHIKIAMGLIQNPTVSVTHCVVLMFTPGQTLDI